MKIVWVIAVAIVMCVSPLLGGCAQKQDDANTQAAVKTQEPVVETQGESETDTEAVSEEPQEAQQAPEPVKTPDSNKPIMEGIQPPTQQVAAPSQPTEPQPAPQAQEPTPGELMVADFNSGEKPSNIGGDFGAWNKDPADPTQWCNEGFDSVTKRGDAGFAMKLDYSVESKNPAYNGFWMFLNNLDASKYDNLAFWVKGDPRAGFTTVFKIELKNAAKQVGRYYVTTVTDQWQEVVIPLKEFKGLIDLTSLTEFVIVFEDRIASNKKGVIYIDDIKFTKNN